MANNQVMRPLFGDGTIQTVSGVFDEIGLVVEALYGHVDMLTDEGERLEVIRMGTQIAIAVNRLRQLQCLGFDLAVQVERPARVTTGKGR